MLYPPPFHKTQLHFKCSEDNNTCAETKKHPCENHTGVLRYSISFEDKGD